ncbi:hypothetical protein RB195_007790 [Necator americanus]|uniref:Protein-L-isoaspartate(D-aspartate) O-methyltransferase n=1 Tax=Necator americanus TaxID=51031 RepID=A0ABR1C2P9_NECAM
MGVAASRDNDDLTDNLVRHGQIVSKEVELVFRLVDRGRFFPSEYIDEAYRDNPFKVPAEANGDWTPGKLHISAPSMYATVLEKLDLRTGHAFLNIGSGTGWLSTAAGFLIGGSGINHGVEIHENLIKFAEEKLAETLLLPEISAFNWAKPAFFHGNGLAQELTHSKYFYDRVYCGAAVSDLQTIAHLIKLLEIGGKLIVPFRNSLTAYTRTAESSYISEVLMACQFADLLPPKPEDRTDCLPCVIRPPSLADHCRNVIRESLRKKVLESYPVFMRSIVDSEGALGSDDASSHPDADTEVTEGQRRREFGIIRHPIRVELIRNLGAARIRLETNDRTAREDRNRDERRDHEEAEDTENHEGVDNDRHEDTNRDVEVGAGMFVFADEGPPSDDEELGEEDRMGLQWLNAILGFERDRVTARMRRHQAHEDERIESESSNDGSSTDLSSNAENPHPVENITVERPPEPETNGADHVEEDNHDLEQISSKETNGTSSDDSIPKVEAMESPEEEQITTERNNEEETIREEEERNEDDMEAGVNETGGNAGDETDRENEDHDWDNFPMREMIELSEFLGEANNRSRAEERGRRIRNGTNGAGTSRRNGPRSSMSRRAIKRARLAEAENQDESEKQAEEERDRQKASLKVFGEAFDEAMRKLPLPKHLIKFLSLQSVTPMFASNQTPEWS